MKLFADKTNEYDNVYEIFKDTVKYSLDDDALFFILHDVYHSKEEMEQFLDKYNPDWREELAAMNTKTYARKSFLLQAVEEIGGAKKKRDMEKDLSLMPWIVADKIVSDLVSYLRDNEDLEEDLNKLSQDIRGKLGERLTEQANAIYQANDDWANKLRRAKDPRPLFYAFMQHWLSSELYKHYPKIFKALPYGYTMGHDLPSKGASLSKTAEPDDDESDYLPVEQVGATDEDEIFIRPIKKSEKGNPTRSLSSIPDKEGYEKAYKPYGGEGHGFYYIKKTAQEDEGGKENTTDKPTIEEVEIIIEPDYDPDTSYLEQEGFENRLEELERGAFSYVGIFAQATVMLKGHLQTFRSGGLWGIEDDIGKDYFKEVAQEEIAQLKEELQSYNVDMSNFDELAEGAIAEM